MSTPSRMFDGKSPDSNESFAARRHMSRGRKSRAAIEDRLMALYEWMREPDSTTFTQDDASGWIARRPHWVPLAARAVIVSLKREAERVAEKAQGRKIDAMNVAAQAARNQAQEEIEQLETVCREARTEIARLRAELAAKAA